MRKLNGFIYFCALTMICGVANAQIQIVIDNQLIPAEDIAFFSMTKNGAITVTTTDGYTVEPKGTEPPPPGAVEITSFSVSPLSLTEGESVAISWSSLYATSCAASSSLVAWNGTVGTSGSTSSKIDTANTYSLTLTCQGEAGPVSSTKSVTVTTPVVDPEPEPRSCATPPLSGTTTAWKEFWRVPFPGPVYDNQDVNVGKYNYLALEFNTGNVAGTGFLGTVSNTITSGIRLGSISECPGDFNVAPECDFRWGTSGGIGWSTIGERGACQVEPNKTYYFNVTFTDGSDPTTSNCTSSLCYATLQHVQF